MYSNIGAKIKVLAQIIAWVGIIGSVVAGTMNIATDEDLVALGLGIIIGGSLISWISSWFMYGFGELIEKTTEIASNTAFSLVAKMESERKRETPIF